MRYVVACVVKMAMHIVLYHAAPKADHTNYLKIQSREKYGSEKLPHFSLLCWKGDVQMNVRKAIDYDGMFKALDTLMSKALPQMELYCEIVG